MQLSSSPVSVGEVARFTSPTLTSRRKRSNWAASLADAAMIGPALVMVLVFVIVPIGIAGYLSLTNWDGFTMPPKWVGIDNYNRLFSDPEVLRAAGLTFVIAVVGTVACNLLGLGVALLVDRNTRVNSFVRVLVFYPYVVGPVILGFLWASILGANGAINAVLQSAGQDRLPFLADPQWAVVTLISVIVWSSFGMNVVLYLAGLQTVDASLIEAARIDGASNWQTFWQVKLALIAPTVTLNAVLSAIALLRVYEIIVALTAGGPAGATQSSVFNILSTSFNRSQLGYGAAQSVVLMAFIILVTVVLTRVRRGADDAVAS